MRKRTRFVVGDITENELRVIELRTNGVKPREIARRLGIAEHAVNKRIQNIYDKFGFRDLALLTRWAIANALDEPIEVEAPAPEVRKPGRSRIKLGRIKRARA